MIDPELVIRAFPKMPAALLITGNRRIVECNDAFASLFGYSRAELMNASLLMLYPSRADYRRIGQRSLHWLVTHDSYEDERFMKQRSGEIFWVKARGVTLTPDTPFQSMVWSYERLLQTGRRPSDLTSREREISGHIINGRTSREIAAVLGISRRTVEVHRTRLMSKLKARNVAELVSRIVETRSAEG